MTLLHHISGSRARFAGAILAASLLLGGITACSSEPEWHPVTTEESQELALARFNNFDLGIREFQTDITVQGYPLRINGWVDYLEHTGYAGVTDEQGSSDQGLLWNPDTVALMSLGLDQSGLPPQDLTDAGTPDIRGLDPSSSNLDTLLLFLLTLGNDRPENPLLLQQAGALWLGTETAEHDGDTIELNVYAPPASEEALTADDPPPVPEDAVVKMKVDDRGVLHSADAQLAGEWVTVTFLDGGETASSPSSLPDIAEFSQQ